MSRNDVDVREPRLPEGPEMIAAMRLGVVAALREHKRQGVHAVVWDHATQQVVHIPADEIVIPEDEATANGSDSAN